MKKLIILLSLLSTPLNATSIKQGEFAGSVFLYTDHREGYVCGILLDKEGHMRHFITERPSILDITTNEVEPISKDTEKDVFDTQWLDANYWPKCPILSTLYK